MIRWFAFALFPILFSCSAGNKPSAKIDVPLNTPLIFPALPAKMTFAGQQVILTDEDLIERLDREVMLNAYFQSATNGFFKRATRYFPVIERILKEERVPLDFKYLAVIESGLLQNSSPAGARGLWQLMPSTAGNYGLEISTEVDERLHLEKSTRAACRYLRDAHDSLGDWLLAAAAYNRGVGGIRQDMAWQGTDHYFDTDQNSETGRYVFRLLAVKLIFDNPEAYGYYPEQMQCYPPLKTTGIAIDSTIPNVAEWARANDVNYKIVQKLNPWIQTNRLTVKDKPYRLLLPAAGEHLKPYEHYLHE